MLRYILVETAGLFDGDTSRGISEMGLLWWLEALARWNRHYLQEHPELPKLYESGVRYKLPEQLDKQPVSEATIRGVSSTLQASRAPQDTINAVEAILRGSEHFRDIQAIIQHGGGDCDNVTGWRVAELRAAGIEAMPGVTSRKRPDGGTTYHALVYWPDGTSEDPSLILGMGGPARAADRAEEIRKNKERYTNMIAAAHALCEAGQLNEGEAGQRIDAMGLLPRDEGMGWK